ncbi:hypothetical protein CEXT_617881 [Caerostris extrusa]|uniref:Uncharacterized protein n=1 Tax=Caerostris extrusa TaxID=172846 RepID=A0AAV4PMX9_CAEEX|nr:hypothetical protein CEXT_617881 [Caerostris extrusa]
MKDGSIQEYGEAPLPGRREEESCCMRTSRVFLIKRASWLPELVSGRCLVGALSRKFQQSPKFCKGLFQRAVSPSVSSKQKKS